MHSPSSFSIPRFRIHTKACGRSSNGDCRSGDVDHSTIDLPLKYHPAAIRAGGATCDRRSWPGQHHSWVESSFQAPQPGCDCEVRASFGPSSCSGKIRLLSPSISLQPPRPLAHGRRAKLLFLRPSERDVDRLGCYSECDLMAHQDGLELRRPPLPLHVFPRVQ